MKKERKKGRVRKAVRTVTAKATANYDPRWVTGWVVLAASVFIFEMWSLLDGNDATPPLTQVTVKWVPAALVMAFIGWLAVHFGRRYINKKNEGEGDVYSGGYNPSDEAGTD